MEKNENLRENSTQNRKQNKSIVTKFKKKTVVVIVVLIMVKNR